MEIDSGKFHGLGQNPGTSLHMSKDLLVAFISVKLREMFGVARGRAALPFESSAMLRLKEHNIKGQFFPYVPCLGMDLQPMKLLPIVNE